MGFPTLRYTNVCFFKCPDSLDYGFDAKKKPNTAIPMSLSSGRLEDPSPVMSERIVYTDHDWTTFSSEVEEEQRTKGPD